MMEQLQSLRFDAGLILLVLVILSIPLTIRLARRRRKIDRRPFRVDLVEPAEETGKRYGAERTKRERTD